MREFFYNPMQNSVANSTRSVEFFKKNIIVVILCLITAAGFFLRFYKVGESSYWIDEGFTIMQTRAISSHGYPLLNSGQVESKDILLPYVLSAVGKIFGESAFSFRLVSVFFGTAAIILSFVLGRQLFNDKIGLLFSFFMAFSYWHIAWSRQIRGYSALVFFTLLVFINLVLCSETKKIKYVLLSLIFALLAFLSKSFGIFLLLPIVLYFISEKKYIAGLLGLLFLGIAGFFFSHLLINALNVSLVNYSGIYFIGYLWKYFGLVFSMFLVGIFLAIKNNKNRKIHLIILSFITLSFLAFSFCVYIEQKRYLFFLTLFLFLYTAYFIFHIKESSRTIFAIIFLAGVILVDSFTFKTFLFYPQKHFVLEEYTPQPDFNSAYDYIKKEISSNDFMISAYPYMDLIYLNKSDYALSISYTGRPEDTTIYKSKEYYSGTRELRGDRKTSIAGKFERLQEKGNVYVILDFMSDSRIRPRTREYILKNGQVIFQTNDPEKQKVYVYRL